MLLEVYRETDQLHVIENYNEELLFRHKDQGVLELHNGITYTINNVMITYDTNRHKRVIIHVD